MNRKSFRMNWLIPMLGIVLVGGGYAAARSYKGLDQAMNNELQFASTAERVREGVRLLQIQTQLAKGSCPGRARQVDESLSFCVEALDLELASADARTQGFITSFFEHMAHVQSQLAPTAVSFPAKRSETETGS
jgi:uncharacterized protein YecA (UPF0149 family)